LVHKLKTESVNRVGGYINRELSIKSRVLNAMQSELSSHAQTGGAVEKEPGNKKDNYYGHRHEDCVFENPRQIKKDNKLLLSMVKHQELQKIAVSDTFSKKADPIDQYYALREQATQEREKQEIQAKVANAIQEDIQKQIREKMAKLTPKNAASPLANLMKKREAGADPEKLAKDYREFREGQKPPPLQLGETAKVPPPEIPKSVYPPTDRNKYDKMRETPRMFEKL
jgi:hypothetical protein